MNAALPLSRISDDEFDQMVMRGLPGVLGRVELRDGFLYRMSAQHIPHTLAKKRLFLALEFLVRDRGLGLSVDTEVSVRFGAGFTPMPDVVVWKPSARSGPVPGADARLVAEIADTTQTDDLGLKRDAYARAGLPEYWVIDLAARTLHRFAEPKDGVWRQSAVFNEGSTVDALTLPGVSIVFSLPENSPD